MTTIKVPNHDGFVDPDTGNASKVAMNYHNTIASRLNAIGTVAAPALAAPIDLPTALTTITELQTLIAALNKAANK